MINNIYLINIMSYIKGNNETPSKVSIYQTKTVSDKNIHTVNNDLTQTLYLNALIENNQFQEIENFIKKENSSTITLKNGINILLKEYYVGNENSYKLLELFLQAGVSPDIPLSNNPQVNQKIPNISEKDNITLLMLGIIMNDIELINIILKYQPKINQADSSGKNAIIYAILNNNDDSIGILNLLIKNNANINSTIKLKINNKLEYHSAFTLACHKNLPNITQLLIDNYADVNFQNKPDLDTGLHICAKYGYESTLKVLLSCDKINLDIENKDGKRAIDLIPENDKKNDIMKLFYNYYNNKNNKINMKNNGNNFGFQRMNNFNQMSKNHVNNNINNISLNGNEQQNNNINNNMINNINSNYNPYINNINMMNSNMFNINNNEFNDKNESNTNMFNDSSDFSEDHEIKEKPNHKITRKFQRSNNFSTQFNSIKLLNQKIYHNLFLKSNNNFNIEFPVELINKKNNFSKKFNALNNFVSPKLNSIPILNLDITNKCFNLEIKLDELKSQLQEKNKKLAEYKQKNEEQEQTISEKNKILEKNNTDIENMKKMQKENEQKMVELKETMEELKNKIPQDKLYHPTNKDNKLYKELKFIPHQIEDTEMFKILTKDLIDYQKYISEKINRKRQLIKNLINEIKKTLNLLTQDYEIQIYGSYANNLCMPWSDLDLVLVNKNANINILLENENNDNILLEQNLEQQSDTASIANSDSTKESINPSMNPPNQNGLLIYLYYKLKGMPWIKQIILTENLSIKILRIITIDAYSEMSIDISFDSEKHNGLKCVNLINSYLTEYKVLRPITIALKAILQSANLHNPNKGGLSSYGLILMVVSYIQSQRDNFGLKNEPDLIGKIFYGFLKHYGILFDFNKYLILTYPANETNYANNDKESYLNINQFSQEFIILDPLNNKNNVANSSFQFMNLKMAFMIAFMVTMEDCDCGCHYGKAVYENSFSSTEHCYLKRMLNSVRRFQG